MRVRTAVILLLVVFSAVPLAIQGLAGHRLVSETLEDRAFAHLASVSDIQELRLDLVLERDRDRYELIADRNQMRESLAAIDAGEDAGHAERLRRILVDINTTADDLVHLHLFTTSGTLAASTSTVPVPPRVLEWRDAAVAGPRLDLFALDANGRLVHGIAGPVVHGGERVGTLLIETDASRYLELIGLYDGLGETGETTIVFRDPGGDARFLAPTRFDPEAAFRRVVPGEDGENPSVMGLVARRDANVAGVDYRGHDVLASVRYVEPLDWVLVTKMDREEALAPADGLLAVLATITAGVMLAAVVLGALAGVRFLARPVQESAHYADRVRRGEEGDAATVERPGGGLDEVRALDDAVRAMAEALQSTARYRAELLNATSHALRTPLTPLKLQVYQLERLLQDDPQEAALVGKVKKNLARMETTVETFVEASRAETGTAPLLLLPHNLVAVVRAAVAQHAALAEERAVTVRVAAPGDVVTNVDERLLQDAVGHVLEVAVQHTDPGGQVDVDVNVQGAVVHIVVEDMGPPFPEGMETEAFDAFPTLADQDRLLGRATGGLAMTKRLVELHRGSVRIENRHDRAGARVTVELPLAGRAPRTWWRGNRQPHATGS